MRVLLFEPNPYHYEVIPGFAYYFIRLGYEADCLIQKPDQEGDVFFRCPFLKNRIRFFTTVKEKGNSGGARYDSKRSKKDSG